jgi:hypothetical protein
VSSVSQFPPTGLHPGQPLGLADVLDRVLDKGLVVAGDIGISLLDVEVITIKIRLLLCSADKAEELGIDWWRTDPSLSSQASELEQENQSLRERLAELEERVRALGDGQGGDAVPAGDSSDDGDGQG